MQSALGLQLADDVLPLSNAAACLPPFWLADDLLCTMTTDWTRRGEPYHADVETSSWLIVCAGCGRAAGDGGTADDGPAGLTGDRARPWRHR